MAAPSLRSWVHRERLRAQVLQAHRMGNQLRQDHSPDPEIAHRMAVPAADPPPDCILQPTLALPWTLSPVGR